MNDMQLKKLRQKGLILMGVCDIIAIIAFIIFFAVGSNIELSILSFVILVLALLGRMYLKKKFITPYEQNQNTKIYENHNMQICYDNYLKKNFYIAEKEIYKLKIYNNYNRLVFDTKYLILDKTNNVVIQEVIINYEKSNGKKTSTHELFNGKIYKFYFKDFKPNQLIIKHGIIDEQEMIVETKEFNEFKYSILANCNEALRLKDEKMIEEILSIDEKLTLSFTNNYLYILKSNDSKEKKNIVDKIDQEKLFIESILKLIK